MKVIIAGSRELTNCDKALDYLDPSDEIVSGGARGIDSAAIRLAKEHGFRLCVMNADWEKWGKSAGYKRNRQMAEYADKLIAFWDGHSKGTEHMIRTMQQMEKPVIIFR